MTTEAAKYDDQLMKKVEIGEDSTMRLAVSSLGLFSLKNAFHEGSYTIRTSCLDTIMNEEQQHTPFASHVETNYNFTDPKFDLKERYTRPGRNSIKYGKIIEEMDALAGDVSYKYLLQNSNEENFDAAKRDYTLVTVSVDRIDFMDKI
jgi:hypothetical protein